MIPETDSIHEKLMDRMADLSSSKLRWIFAVIASSLLFFVVLGVYLAPVSELSTTQNQQFKITVNTNSEPLRVETIAIPSTYFMHYEFTLTPKFKDQHSSVYVYLFKDEVPAMSLDAVGGDLHSYLKLNAYRNGTLNYVNDVLTWDLAFRDCDTNIFYVMLYNPDDPNDPYDNDDILVDMEANFEPMLPLIPIFFILAFIIVLPIAIIRLYVISQKKKELRILLTLDFENLSNEDKIKLGIPLYTGPQPVQQ